MLHFRLSIAKRSSSGLLCEIPSVLSNGEIRQGDRIGTLEFDIHGCKPILQGLKPDWLGSELCRTTTWEVGQAPVRLTKRMSRRGECKDEERFLSAQADRFAGAKRDERIGLLRAK